MALLTHKKIMEEPTPLGEALRRRFDRDFTADVTALILPIVDRAAMALSVDVLHFPRRRIDDAVSNAAMRWAQTLRNPADRTAAQVGRQLVQLAFGEESNPAFWATDLGQLVFYRDGFPMRPAFRTEAETVLGISRQGAQQSDRLVAAETPGIRERMVTRMSLVLTWNARTGLFVGGSERHLWF